MGSRRLPSGRYTKNVNYYLRAWHDLARPIERATGATLSAFDPDLSFSMPPHSRWSNGVSFELKVSVAKALCRALLAAK